MPIQLAQKEFKFVQIKRTMKFTSRKGLKNERIQEDAEAKDDN